MRTEIKDARRPQEARRVFKKDLDWKKLPDVRLDIGNIFEQEPKERDQKELWVGRQIAETKNARCDQKRIDPSTRLSSVSEQPNKTLGVEQE